MKLQQECDQLKLAQVEMQSAVEKAKGECTKLKIVSKLQRAAVRSAKRDGEATIQALREQLVAAAAKNGAEQEKALQAAASAARDEERALRDELERRITELGAEAQETASARKAEQEASGRIEAALAAQLAVVRAFGRRVCAESRLCVA